MRKEKKQTLNELYGIPYDQDGLHGQDEIVDFVNKVTGGTYHVLSLKTLRERDGLPMRKFGQYWQSSKTAILDWHYKRFFQFEE